MFSFIYWTFFVVCMVAALRVRPWFACIAVMAVLVAVFSAKPIHDEWIRRETRARLEAATALFDRLCATAGERITETASGVRGVLLMRSRTRVPVSEEQFAMNDPYGADCFNVDTCVGILLFNVVRVEGGRPGMRMKMARMFDFVEYADPKTGVHYLYTEATGSAPLERKAIDVPEAKYGVDWEDISTLEQRRLWVAGGSLRVIDLQSGKVMAERIGYLMDTGQGGRGGFRDPWGWAQYFGKSCPKLGEPKDREPNVAFVRKVLLP